MKKILYIFIMLTSILYSITGCNTIVEDTSEFHISDSSKVYSMSDGGTLAEAGYEIYTSLVADSSNDELSLPVETNFWSGNYFQKENMSKKTCSALGKEYTGSYLTSVVEKLNSYVTDIYKTESGVHFGLRSDTGELSSINFMTHEFFETEPYLDDVNDPLNFAVSLATEVAKEYINVSEYKQIIEEPRVQYKEKDGETYELTYYIIDFAREVSGLMTSDYLAVKVTSKGNVASIIMGDVGAFDNCNINVDNKKLEQSINEKVYSSYKIYQDSFILEKATIDDQKLCITPEGDICIYSQVSIDGTYNESQKAKKSGAAILTVVGK